MKPNKKLDQQGGALVRSRTKEQQERIQKYNKFIEKFGKTTPEPVLKHEVYGQFICDPDTGDCEEFFDAREEKIKTVRFGTLEIQPFFKTKPPISISYVDNTFITRSSQTIKEAQTVLISEIQADIDEIKAVTNFVATDPTYLPNTTPLTTLLHVDAKNHIKNLLAHISVVGITLNNMVKVTRSTLNLVLSLQDISNDDKQGLITSLNTLKLGFEIPFKIRFGDTDLRELNINTMLQTRTVTDIENASNLLVKINTELFNLLKGLLSRPKTTSVVHHFVPPKRVTALKALTLEMISCNLELFDKQQELLETYKKETTAFLQKLRKTIIDNTGARGTGSTVVGESDDKLSEYFNSTPTEFYSVLSKLGISKEQIQTIRHVNTRVSTTTGHFSSLTPDPDIKKWYFIPFIVFYLFCTNILSIVGMLINYVLYVPLNTELVEGTLITVDEYNEINNANLLLLNIINKIEGASKIDRIMTDIKDLKTTLSIKGVPAGGKVAAAAGGNGAAAAGSNAAGAGGKGASGGGNGASGGARKLTKKRRKKNAQTRNQRRRRNQTLRKKRSNTKSKSRRKTRQYRK